MNMFFYFNLLAFTTKEIKSSNDETSLLNGIINTNDNITCSVLEGNFEKAGLSRMLIKEFAEFIWYIITNHLNFGFWKQIYWLEYKDEEKRTQMENAYYNAVYKAFDVKESISWVTTSLTEHEVYFIENFKNVTLEYYNVLNHCYKDIIPRDADISQTLQFILENITCFQWSLRDLPIIIVKMCKEMIDPYIRCFGENGIETIIEKLDERNNNKGYIYCEKFPNYPIKHSFSDHDIDYDAFDDYKKNVNNDLGYMSYFPYILIPLFIIILICTIYFKKNLVKFFKKITNRGPNNSEDLEVFFDNTQEV
ncbi:putative SP-containing membrane protein [Vairimorpha necatrix]|uniref:SP-containing membrane protein n=1 Tax=Vairimorpha necatrix TaxID=6039 RepID=A0AAX4JC63_9MICR